MSVHFGSLSTIFASLQTSGAGFGIRPPILLNPLGAIIATGIFLLVLVTISMHWLHETTAALLGMTTLLLTSYIGGTFSDRLAIVTFEDAIQFIDWNVIFLIMGMMIIMAILAETNIFKWLAFQLFRASRGNTWLICVSLILLTGFTSALLNDVTAILLIVPLTIQISAAIGLNPLAIVIPEVLSSNIGGAATLIGDPPSTIVGSHLNLSFYEYFKNMAPIALICTLALILINWYQYQNIYSLKGKVISPILNNQLEAESSITRKPILVKAIGITVLTFIAFFTADRFRHMPPGVIALGGAALLMAWVRPDVQSMLREVDWTTLLFFIGLFVIVGAMENTGVIGWLAGGIQSLAGSSMDKAALIMNWVAGILSGLLANIPFTVAALPVADYLSSNLPGTVSNHIIYWALILGADLGGNATYLGSAPNIVAVGLLAQAGYKVTFGRFLRDGVPVTFVTLVIASIWLLLRY